MNTNALPSKQLQQIKSYLLIEGCYFWSVEQNIAL